MLQLHNYMVHNYDTYLHNLKTSFSSTQSKFFQNVLTTLIVWTRKFAQVEVVKMLVCWRPVVLMQVVWQGATEHNVFVQAISQEIQKFLVNQV